MRQSFQERQGECGENEIGQDDDHYHRRYEIGQQQPCMAAGVFLLFEEVHQTARGLSGKAGRGNCFECFSFARTVPRRYFVRVLSGGVMVAQESLELFVMVRIHAGQPVQGAFQTKRQRCLLHEIVGRVPSRGGILVVTYNGWTAGSYSHMLALCPVGP